MDAGRPAQRQNADSERNVADVVSRVRDSWWWKAPRRWLALLPKGCESEGETRRQIVDSRWQHGKRRIDEQRVNAVAVVGV